MKGVITPGRGFCIYKPLFLLLCLFVVFAPGLNAQSVSINNTGAASNASAMLDVSSTTKGMLIPRMTLVQRTAMNPLPAAAQGLMVYQTDAVEGFYYNTSITTTPNWIYIFPDGAGSAWALTGNAGTTVGTNFIGTTDTQPLMFKVNNLKSGYIDCTSSYNTSFGYGALGVNTTGYQNAATGVSALYSNTLGFYNTAYGANSLWGNTTGTANTAIGGYALFTQSFNNGGAVWGSENVAVGYTALFSNQPTSVVNGIHNTAIGNQALYFNTIGKDNVGNGFAALKNNTIGNQNTAMGAYALYSNVAGSNATAIGDYAMAYSNSYANSFPSENVAIGFEALRGSTNPLNNTGNFNTATGYQSLRNITSGMSNTANGAQALLSNTQGIDNTATGSSALLINDIGNGNTATGGGALNSNTIGNNNTAIGLIALNSNTQGSNNTAIGYEALQNNTTGIYNTAVGSASGPSSNLNNTTSIGYYTGFQGANDQINIGNMSVQWIGGQVEWKTYSDARIKDNVTANVPGLAFITRLRPVTYNLNIHKQSEIVYAGKDRKEEGDWATKYDIEKIRMTGFIAQEVEKAAKAAGYDFSGITIPKSSKELYSLSYEVFVVPLVKGMQEQQEMIKDQKDEIELLKKHIEIMETENASMKSDLEKIQAQLGIPVTVKN